jgi:hypothetical protein
MNCRDAFSPGLTVQSFSALAKYELPGRFSPGLTVQSFSALAKYELPGGL